MLYRLRSHTADFKSEFKSMHDNIQWRLGCKDDENLQHTIQCQFILNAIGDELKKEVQNTNLQHIFGNEDEQKAVTKIYIKLLNVREDIVKSNWRNGST